jgi:hypothetical protein
MTEMNIALQFQRLLQASGEGFVWSARQVPDPRRYLHPPVGLGEWSATRHIFHLVFYEQTFALPAMRWWLAEPPQPLPGLDEEEAWGEGKEAVESLLTEFQKVRDEQLALLAQFTGPVWNTSRMFYSGPVTLAWLVTKTIQHTADHTNGLLRIALFWDFVEAQNQPGAQAIPKS